jgi:hypothetical protein
LETNCTVDAKHRECCEIVARYEIEISDDFRPEIAREFQFILPRVTAEQEHMLELSEKTAEKVIDEFFEKPSILLATSAPLECRELTKERIRVNRVLWKNSYQPLFPPMVQDRNPTIVPDGGFGLTPAPGPGLGLATVTPFGESPDVPGPCINIGVVWFCPPQ